MATAKVHHRNTQVLGGIVKESANIVRLLGAETGLKLSLEMPQRIGDGGTAAAVWN